MYINARINAFLGPCGHVLAGPQGHHPVLPQYTINCWVTGAHGEVIVTQYVLH